MIPVLIGAALLGGLGVKKTVSAASKISEAKEIASDGERIVARAERNRDDAKETADNSIKTLGKTKVKILSGHMKDFVDEFQNIKHVDFRSSQGLEELKNFKPDSPELKELADAADAAVEISAGVITGGLAGGAAALGAYGAVGALATASTGTAIATLSGAAATNATLAWLGGGTLAAGGLGVTGGMAVLGGIVAAPAILVAGIFMENKADKALSEARSYRCRAREFEAKCENAVTFLQAVWTRADQITDILKKLDSRFAVGLKQMKDVIYWSGTDYRSYSEDEQKQVMNAAMLAKTLKIIMDTPLLTEDGGALTNASAKMVETAAAGNVKTILALEK